MEMQKRKRRDDGEIDGKRARVREHKGGVTTTEEPKEDEVEEFFAILRRIHETVKYFQKGNGGGSVFSAKARWSPAFELEDFENVDGVKGPAEVEEDGGLDLNADPEIESDDQNSS